MHTPQSQPVADHLATALRRELDEGEELLWSAQPSVREFVKLTMRPIWFVAVMLVFFPAMFTFGMVTERLDEWQRTLGSDSPSFFLYLLEHWGWLTPWLIVLPPLILIVATCRRKAASDAQSTVYAVTPKRAIELRIDKRGGTTERDYRADELIHLLRQESADGTGTLIFESARPSSTNSSVRPRFIGIQDVLGVERMLRGLFGDA